VEPVVDVLGMRRALDLQIATAWIAKEKRDLVRLRATITGDPSTRPMPSTVTPGLSLQSTAPIMQDGRSGEGAEQAPQASRPHPAAIASRSFAGFTRIATRRRLDAHAAIRLLPPFSTARRRTWPRLGELPSRTSASR
jgi:hypothetical protein